MSHGCGSWEVHYYGAGEVNLMLKSLLLTCRWLLCYRVFSISPELEENLVLGRKSGIVGQ